MKMNVPNRLTIIRLLLVPVFLVFILGFGGVTWGRIVSIAVFALASFTDFLDGKIAFTDILRLVEHILNSEKTSSYSDYREIISLHSRVYDGIIRDYAHILRY